MAREDLSDIAVLDRRRLDRLLALEVDPMLDPADPEPLGGLTAAEWCAGFHDSEAGVRITVAFIRDPASREAAARALRAAADAGAGKGRAVRVSTNGGMLFYGWAPSGPSSAKAEARLRNLAGRFAGEE